MNNDNNNDNNDDNNDREREKNMKDTSSPYKNIILIFTPNIQEWSNN